MPMRLRVSRFSKMGGMEGCLAGHDHELAALLETDVSGAQQQVGRLGHCAMEATLFMLQGTTTIPRVGKVPLAMGARMSLMA